MISASFLVKNQIGNCQCCLPKQLYFRLHFVYFKTFEIAIFSHKDKGITAEVNENFIDSNLHNQQQSRLFGENCAVIAADRWQLFLKIR
ncbi:MAG: hypothetical protein VKL59_02820 [Nostocaceae cyanobacterium]|nr:hypothetical protein [Nostocaceae cyanobacterium]